MGTLKSITEKTCKVNEMLQDDQMLCETLTKLQEVEREATAAQNNPRTKWQKFQFENLGVNMHGVWVKKKDIPKSRWIKFDEKRRKELL